MTATHPVPRMKHMQTFPTRRASAPGQAPALGPAGAVVNSARLVLGLGEVNLNPVRESLPRQLVTDRRTGNGATPSKPRGGVLRGTWARSRGDGGRRGGPGDPRPGDRTGVWAPLQRHGVLTCPSLLPRGFGRGAALEEDETGGFAAELRRDVGARFRVRSSFRGRAVSWLRSAPAPRASPRVRTANFPRLPSANPGRLEDGVTSQTLKDSPL